MERPGRTLIVLLNETRAHELTFTLFKKNVMDRLGADLALCVGDSPRETPNVFYDHAKYVWKYKEPEDWGEAFDAYTAPGHDARALLELPDQWFGGVGHPARPDLVQAGSGALQLFFREFLRHKLEEEGLFEKYDWFIATRSDCMWPVLFPPLSLLSPDHLYLPDGERYRGVTDRCVMAPSPIFRRFMDITRAIFEEPEALAARMKARRPIDWNTESFVKFRLDELGLTRHVRFFPYMMYTVKALGGSTGEGAPGGDNFELHLYVKYPMEYTTTRALQCVVQEEEDWKHMIGPARLLNWRFYLFSWLRVLSEKHKYPRRFRTLRLLKRFAIYVAQPL